MHTGIFSISTGEFAGFLVAINSIKVGAPYIRGVVCNSTSFGVKITPGFPCIRPFIGFRTSVATNNLN